MRYKTNHVGSRDFEFPLLYSVSRLTVRYLFQASILSKHVTSHERVNAGKEEHLFGIPPNLAKEREMEGNLSFNCDKCLFVSQSAQGRRLKLYTGAELRVNRSCQDSSRFTILLPSTFLLLPPPSPALTRAEASRDESQHRPEVQM